VKNAQKGLYSEVADSQLDELEAGPDMGLYNAVLVNCDLIFRKPGEAQANSTAITTDQGIRLRLPVPGYPPFKIFWSTDGPTIEAVFPFPTG
jgi:hypothetical protein